MKGTLISDIKCEFILSVHPKSSQSSSHKTRQDFVTDEILCP